MTPDVAAFLDAARSRGLSDDTVRELLRARGWSEREIFAALRGHNEALTGLEIPAPPAGGTQARDAFLHVLSLGSLGTWTIALGLLCFRLLDRWLPDPLSAPWRAPESVTAPIAALVVGFPVFLFSLHWIGREVKENTARLDGSVRRWLCCLALFLAAVIAAVNLITFVNYVLRDDLSLRFLGKVTAVFLIAGGVCCYYFPALRGDPPAGWPRQRVRDLRFAAFAGALVAAGLAAGFPEIEWMGQERQFAADKRRLRDLAEIAGAVSAKAAAGSMPATLEQAFAGTGGPPRDPVTRAPYGYGVRGGWNYELCATFATSGDRRSRSAAMDSAWYHKEGRHCFVFHALEPPPRP